MNRNAIIEFVNSVTRPNSPSYVPPNARIAAFDNDGTLLCEKPNYTQMQFAVDRIKASFSVHPEWQELAHIRELVASPREMPVTLKGQNWLDVFMLSSSNVTVDTYTRAVVDWFEDARHPDFKTRYSTLAYSPMTELIRYLHENEFKVYIVTGSSNNFMRPWTTQIYGIPPERVIGSRMELKYESVENGPRLSVSDEIARFNIGPSKPISIQEAVGQRPILAFGNSNGDIEMLEWTCSGPKQSMGLILLHDDAAREYAYDQEAKVYDLATKNEWKIVSIKKDFKEVFENQITR
ncbi:haloacid dehalogenase-like hydrolase [Verrucomicrobia bacterium]|nr:haloacid dehalogenase-like hydrolase [Verrucomicrobiota bacterium]